MNFAIRTICAVVASSLAALLPLQAASLEPARDGASDELAVAGRQSSDLRVRIVYSLDYAFTPDGSFRRTEPIPVEALVEQARGSTDPVTLSLMVDRCDGIGRQADRCDGVDMARRWTVADTQNQLAWVALATALGKQGDVDGSRAAFRRAAEASQWHEYYPEIARLLAVAAPKGRGAQEEAAILLAVLSRSFVSLPAGHYQTINQRCKDFELRDACGRILETMSRDARSLQTLNLSAGLAAARSALPPATVATLRQRSDAMVWAVHQDAKRIPQEPVDEVEARVVVSHLQALIAQDEIGMLRRSLQDARISESEAARRYVATLSAEQIAHRADPNAKAASSAR